MATPPNNHTLYKLVGIVAGLAVILGGKMCMSARTGPSVAKAQAALSGLPQIMDAVTNRRAGITVQHWGTVSRTLADDQGADKLQKFIVTLENGHMLLFAHNVDIAQRAPLSTGDRVEFRGRFDWNDVGGLVHRTHHDPQMTFEDGWLRHNGKVYR
jgi:hypothetical protein